MSLITVAGTLLAALGLASGVVLLLAPFGITTADPGLVTWGLFPVLSILGYVLIALGEAGAVIARLSRLMGGIALLVALAALLTLFAVDNGLLAAQSSTMPLWYVLVLGLVFGVTGLSVAARVQQATQPSA